MKAPQKKRKRLALAPPAYVLRSARPAPLITSAGTAVESIRTSLVNGWSVKKKFKKNQYDKMYSRRFESSLPDHSSSQAVNFLNFNPFTGPATAL